MHQYFYAIHLFVNRRKSLSVLLAVLMLLVFGASPTAVIACLLLFGIGSGAFAVARATMPLVYFKRAEYAAAMSMIALPMNLTSALAAPALSGILTISGASTTLMMLVLCSGASLCILLKLGALTKFHSISATTEKRNMTASG